MQFLENWDPLKLPRGSIRALITLALLGTFWALLLLDRESPLILGYVVVLIVGYYFGARSGKKPDGGNSPLFLPRGSIRFLIVIGSGAAAYAAWSLGKLDVEHSAFGVIVCIGAMLLGAVVRKLADLASRRQASTPRRWFENLKSVVALMAAALLVVLSLVEIEDPGVSNLQLIAGLLVGFYFGSRN